MGRAGIFGQIKLSTKEVSGWIRDKAKVRFFIRQTVDMKDTGGMINEKARACSLRTTLQSELSTDLT